MTNIWRYFKIHKPILYEFIIKLQFSFVPKTFNERLYLIKNDMTTNNKCCCGENIKSFINFNQGYRTFCSNFCQRNNNYNEWKKEKHPCHRDGIQLKVRKTHFERYGVETPFELPLIQQKIINNNVLKFGFPKPNQRPEVKLKLKQSLKEFFSDDLRKKEWIEKHNVFENKRFSKIADIFFKHLIQISNIKRDDVRFSEDEFCFRLNESDKFGRVAYYSDFKFRNKIIEFNGDIFHANPSLFETDDKPNPFRHDLTSKMIWEMDDERLNNLKYSGFELLVVWEKDAIEKFDETIEKCLKYLDV